MSSDFGPMDTTTGWRSRGVSPAWDRTVQCAFRKYVRTDKFNNLDEAPAMGEAFRGTVQNFYLEMKHKGKANDTNPFFCLPPHLRGLIC